MGYIYAFFSSLFFVLYALPKKKSKIKPDIYVFIMGVSCLILALSFYLLFGTKEGIYNSWLLLSILGGIMWFVASVLFFYSIDKIGVARSCEFKSIQGPIGSILMLVFLEEYFDLNIYLIILAILFIFFAAFSLVINEKNIIKIRLKDVFIALLAAVFYGLTGFIRKIVTLKGLVYIQQVYTSIGLVIAGIIYLIVKRGNNDLKIKNNQKYYLAILSGFFYYFASYFMILSYKKIEGTVAFPIIQLNSIYSCIIGIFIFKEINYKKHKKRISFGLLLAILGIIFLVIGS